MTGDSCQLGEFWTGSFYILRSLSQAGGDDIGPGRGSTARAADLDRLRSLVYHDAMKSVEVLRKELLSLLDGGNAHMSFADVVAEFPMDRINSKPANCPYSFWHFVEHIRIAQWDIVEFILNPQHASPSWPEGYRPRPGEKTDARGWAASVAGVLEDLERAKGLVVNPSTDFFKPIPHAPGYTIFRELLLIADHNSHHVGELAIMRQIEDLWPRGGEYLTG
jgi:hypothetical protein